MPTVPVTNQSNSNQSMDQPPHHPFASYPTDRDALRALYRSQYTDYIATYNKMTEQKRKIDAALKGEQEAEADLLEPEEIYQLVAEHESRRKELEHITDIYMNGTTSRTGGSRF